MITPKLETSSHSAHRIGHFVAGNDSVSLKNRSGAMARYRHRNLLIDALDHEITDGRAPEIMDEKGRYAGPPTCTRPRGTEVFDLIAVTVKHEPAVETACVASSGNHSPEGTNEGQHPRLSVLGEVGRNAQLEPASAVPMYVRPLEALRFDQILAYTINLYTLHSSQCN